MVDMGILVGDIRRLGLVGPPYEVIGPAAPLPNGDAQMRIHLIETGEDVDYPIADILNDPRDD
jgi:hypothetical protein